MGYGGVGEGGGGEMVGGRGGAAPGASSARSHGGECGGSRFVEVRGRTKQKLGFQLLQIPVDLHHSQKRHDVKFNGRFTSRGRGGGGV